MAHSPTAEFPRGVGYVESVGWEDDEERGRWFAVRLCFPNGPPDLTAGLVWEKRPVQIVERSLGAPGVEWGQSLAEEIIAHIDPSALAEFRACRANLNNRTARCPHCSAEFEAGAGTGRRRDAKFCTDEHRIAFNSLKRSKVVPSC